MKGLCFLFALTISFSSFAVSEKCEEKMTSAAQKIITESDEITDLQPMDENNFVVTYYMYGTCYGSIFLEISTDCDIVSVEENYYPRCH